MTTAAIPAVQTQQQIEITTLTYDDALLLRLSAEQTNDPDLYDQAAVVFETIGMSCAAQRCRERAAYYKAD